MAEPSVKDKTEPSKRASRTAKRKPKLSEEQLAKLTTEQLKELARGYVFLNEYPPITDKSAVVSELISATADESFPREFVDTARRFLNASDLLMADALDVLHGKFSPAARDRLDAISKWGKLGTSQRRRDLIASLVVIDFLAHVKKWEKARGKTAPQDWLANKLSHELRVACAPWRTWHISKEEAAELLEAYKVATRKGRPKKGQGGGLRGEHDGWDDLAETMSRVLGLKRVTGSRLAERWEDARKSQG